MACHIKKSSGSLKKCILDVLWKLVGLDLWTLCITTVQYFTASLLRTQGAAAAAALSSPHPSCVANSQVTVASVLFCVIVFLSLLANICFCCVSFGVFSTKLFMIGWEVTCFLCQMGLEMSTQSVVQLKNLITGQSVHCSDLSCNVCLIDLCYPHI